MKYHTKLRRKSAITLVTILTLAIAACEQPSITTKTDIGCPIGFGWSEGLAIYLEPTAKMSTKDTAKYATPDCAFHQWSWQTFVWANALDENGTPRFMKMPTPAQLLTDDPKASKTLRLASRAHATQQVEGVIEGAGAIVEADGNMLVAPNGYPVYASVHMNSSYFTRLKRT